MQNVLTIRLIPSKPFAEWRKQTNKTGEKWEGRGKQEKLEVEEWFKSLEHEPGFTNYT